MAKSMMKKNFKRAYRDIEALSKYTGFFRAVYGLLDGILPFITVFFTAKLVETILVSRDTATIVIYAALMLGLTFLIKSINELIGKQQWVVFDRLYNKETENVTQKLLSLNYKHLDDSALQTIVKKYSEKIEKENGHLSELSWCLCDFASNFIKLIIGLLMVAPIIKLAFVKTNDSFVGSPYFLLVIAAIIAISALLIFVIQKRENIFRSKSNEEFLVISKTLNYYEDIISNYKNGKDIRLFKAQPLIDKSATNVLLTKGVALQNKIAKFSGRCAAMTTITGVVASLGIYLFIGLKGLSGAFGISQLVQYIGSFMILVEGIIGLVGCITYLIYINKTISYYYDVIDYKTDTIEKQPLQLSENYQIEFRNVSFRYPETTDYALKDASFTLSTGDKIAIVGRNGSGKTTFIKLLTGMYDNYEGDILINSINLKDIDVISYQKIFGVIFQDFKIFALTIAENIAASDEYDINKINSAAKKSGILPFINKLPNKEETFLSKDYENSGVDISGGEEQKLGIARAFYKDSPIVILDEPTAALDPMAEAEFYDSFNNYALDKTVIYISHRLSSCVFCPKIVVFDGGKIIQVGSHAELLADVDGLYSSLWNAQAQYYN